MSEWRTISFDDVPRCAGCYVLVVDNLYLYVGASANLRLRLSNSRIQRLPDKICTPWGTCSSIALKIKPSLRRGDWLMEEYRLIRKLRPILNSAGSTNRRWDRRDGNGFPLKLREYLHINHPEPATVEEFISGIRFQPLGVSA